MNFTDSSSDNKLKDSPARKGGDAIESTGTTPVDRGAMDMAKKAQKHIHDNEQTNSSNTTFSK